MFRSAHNVWLTVAMVVVIGIGTYSYLDGQAFRDAARSAERSRLVVERTHELQSLLKDAENGQRGYLLTGELVHLVDYKRALPKIREALSALGPDVGGLERRRLSELVGIELDELARTIRIRDQGDSTGALAIVQTGRGKQIMDEVHDLVTRNIAWEETRYLEYNATAQRHGYQTRILIQVVLLLLFGLLWFATRRINRLLESQNRLIADLEMTREREARGSAALATTLRSIGDAVIATDIEGRIHFMNAVAEMLTGWTNVAAAGRRLGDVLHIEDELTGQAVPDLALQAMAGGVMGLAVTPSWSAGTAAGSRWTTVRRLSTTNRGTSQAWFWCSTT